MHRQQVVQEITDCLSRSAWAGSPRKVAFDKPLGELGLGIDSLAFVGFLSAVEKRFGVVIPESLWTDRRQLTLDALIEVILSEDGSSPVSPASRFLPVESPDLERCAGRRPPNGTGWSELASRVMAALVEREAFHILSFDLVKMTIPPFPPRPTIQIRMGEVPHTEHLRNLIPAPLLKRKLLRFEQRLRSGWICLTAWKGGSLVGIDWIAQREHLDSETGLRFVLSEGTCCGVDLFEKHTDEGKGVGLSLLYASLAESKRTGFTRQVTVVSKKNSAMMGASVHLLGFQTIGSIQTTRILRRPFSLLEIDGKSRPGWTVTL